MIYTVLVKGTPKSIQSSSKSKAVWKSKVAAEARKVFNTPLPHTDLRAEITIFHNGVPTWNPDNMSKPIVDAMIGVAYSDDIQVIEREVRKKSLDWAFKIRGVPPELATALCSGEDCVWIRIFRMGREVENI